MRTLVVVASGAADRPLDDLGGRTPLEAAATPMLDRAVRDGRLGRIAPAPKGMRPEESAFILGLYGLDALSYGEVGGALDAAAFDIEVGPRDLAFRLALVTADDETIFDPTAGGISGEEARSLLEALEENVADPEFVFCAGDGASNVLVWRGARDIRARTLPPYEVVGKSLKSALPRGTGLGRLLDVMERSAAVFPRHEVNELRVDLGENAATMVWPWTPGVSLPLPDFTARKGVSADAIGTDPAFLGAAELQGIGIGLHDGEPWPAAMLRAKTTAALTALAQRDVVFLHVDGLTRASHARDFAAKVETLERIDGYVLGAAMRAIDEGLEARVVFIAGPAVSTETGRYLTDPVPFAIYGKGVQSHRKGAFTEVAARDGGFHVERTHELLDFLLHLSA